MSFDHYRELGSNIANDWGIPGDKTRKEKISALNNETMIVCLLARLIEIADNIHTESVLSRYAIDRIDKKLAKRRKSRKRPTAPRCKK